MMAASRIKALPVFNEEEDYLNWKNDLEVWKLFTDTEKKEDGSCSLFNITPQVRLIIITDDFALDLASNPKTDWSKFSQEEISEFLS